MSLDRSVVYQPGGVPGSLITEDMQIEFDGMLFGPGTWLGYKKLTGWEDLPGLDVASSPIPQNHGEFPGRILMGEKVITFETQLFPPNADEWAALMRALKRVTSVVDEERPLIVRQHGETSLVYARVTGRSLPIDREYFNRHPRVTIQWTASDPKKYSLVENVITLSALRFEGGLSWDTGLSWGDGLAWGSLATGGIQDATNMGYSATYPEVEFIGPISGPFALRSPDWTLGFDRSLNPGDIITVDCRTGTATFNYGGNALYDLGQSSDIPEDCTLEPGSTTLWLDTASSTDSGQVRVSWRDAQD